MNTLDNLELLCKKFIEKTYLVEEFQSRLYTLLITDDLKAYMEREITRAISELDEIRFTRFEENQYKYGSEVANTLLEFTANLKKRLKS